MIPPVPKFHYRKLQNGNHNYERHTLCRRHREYSSYKRCLCSHSCWHTTCPVHPAHTSSTPLPGLAWDGGQASALEEQGREQGRARGSAAESE